MRATWNPLKTVAQSSFNGWTIDLDPTKPNQAVELSCGKFSWQALSIQPLPNHSLIPEEIYVRQQDLIARFAQGTNDLYALQVDYRLLEAPEGFDLALEVWLTVQTSLLDGAPKLKLVTNGHGTWNYWTHSQLASDHDASQQADAGWSEQHEKSRAAMLLSGSGCSCLWLVEPRDQSQINWISDVSQQTQQAEIFGSFLEKGVIRRARLQLLATQRSVQHDDIKIAYDFLRQRELPLTA